MLLTDMLNPQRIKVPLATTAKNDVITELVDLLAADGSIQERDKVLTSVLEREHTRTTGIGNGLALPHGKTAAVGELVMAIGKPAAPIDFASVDGKPVTLIFLLVSPLDKTGPHIQALARISRLLSIDAFRSKLNAATSPQDLFQVIKTQEQLTP